MPISPSPTPSLVTTDDILAAGRSELDQCRPGVIIEIPTDDFLAACPPTPCMKLNADKTVAVSTEVYWIEDMTSCPRGVKVQLLGAGGVAQYGTYDGKNPFWKKWQSVPRNRPAS